MGLSTPFGIHREKEPARDGESKRVRGTGQKVPYSIKLIIKKAKCKCSVQPDLETVNIKCLDHKEKFLALAESHKKLNCSTCKTNFGLPDEGIFEVFLEVSVNDVWMGKIKIVVS